MQYALEHSHTQQAIKARLARGPRSNYLRDWIYGGIDGAVTTFAIVAGVAGADLSATVVLLLGFANLFADGLAMGASNYIGTKAERDDYNRVLGIEQKHIALVPDGEREEVRQIFAAKGFSDDDLERIVTVITSDRALWAKTMAVEEYGLSPNSEIARLRRAQHFYRIHYVRPRAARCVSFGGRTHLVHCRGRCGLLRRRRHQEPMVAGDMVEVRPRDPPHRYERGGRRLRRRLRPKGTDIGLTWIKPVAARMRFILVRRPPSFAACECD
jgi:hypothetical protein